MRKVMALAAIALLASTQRASALVGLEGLSWDGSVEVSGFSGNNEADSDDAANDRRGGANSRLRLGVNATVTDDVKTRLELVRTGGQFGNGASSVAGEEGAWLFQNAFLDFTSLWGFTARLGRQYVGNPGDLVWRVGPFEDDSLSVNALDGLLIGRSWDFIGFDAFVGKAQEDDGLANTDADDAVGAGDVNVSAVHAWLPTILPGGKIWLGWINGSDLNSASSSDNNRLNIARLGANGGVLENLLTYRAEYLQDFGNSRASGTKVDYKGSALDLGLGVNVPENSVGSFGVAADYTWASGDDNKGNDEDKSFRDLSAVGLQASDRYYGEIFGKSNAFTGGTPFGQGLDLGTESNGFQIVHGAVSLKPAFAPKSWWRVDYFNFGADKNDDYGDEWDFTAGYKHSDNVGFEGGFAFFSPDDGVLAVGAPDDATTKWFGKVKVKWGGSAS